MASRRRDMESPPTGAAGIRSSGSLRKWSGERGRHDEGRSCNARRYAKIGRGGVRRDSSGAIMSTDERGTETGMRRYPTLHTVRLVLRAFTLGDAPEVRRLAGEWEVARTLLSVPHPYGEGLAEEWISGHPSELERNEGVHFAVVLREREEICGACGLIINSRDANAELGYWIGVPYWGRGYATEAAREVLRYGFEDLRLHRVYAAHFGNNPASGTVLTKIGMSYEGTRREHHRKYGDYEDRVEYGLLAREWLAARRRTG